MGDTNNYFSVIKSMLSILSKRNVEIQAEYVEKVYNQASQIYEDYYKILNDSRMDLKYNQKSIKEVVKFLDHKRLPFKSARDNMRGVLSIDYYNDNNLIKKFSIGIMGMLEGGIYNDSIQIDEDSDLSYLNSYIDPQNRHALVDIIKKYDPSISEYIYTGITAHRPDIDIAKKTREMLIRDIELQLKAIETYWAISIKAYNELKYDFIKKNIVLDGRN